VIWVVVQHDVVAVPQPVVGVVVVIGSHAPVKAAEPEAVSAPAFDAINVIATNFAAETSVFPNVVLMIVGVVAAPVMTDPVIAFSMYVRGFGMAWLVAIRSVTLPLVATGMADAVVPGLRLR